MTEKSHKDKQQNSTSEAPGDLSLLAFVCIFPHLTFPQISHHEVPAVPNNLACLGVYTFSWHLAVFSPAGMLLLSPTPLLSEKTELQSFLSPSQESLSSAAEPSYILHCLAFLWACRTKMVLWSLNLLHVLCLSSQRHSFIHNLVLSDPSDL